MSDTVKPVGNRAIWFDRREREVMRLILTHCCDRAKERVSYHQALSAESCALRLAAYEIGLLLQKFAEPLK